MRKNENKRIDKRKNRFFQLFFSLIGVLILVLGIILGSKLFFNTNTRTKVVGQYPVKTSKSNAYIESSAVPVASGSVGLVADAGDAQWIQMKSAQQLQKFTDFSSTGIKIIRVNNAKVLKTTTSLASPDLLMSDLTAKYPDTLIMNASYFNMSTGAVAGFQINNGKLINDWTSGAETSFVINSNGTVATYDASTPASTIIHNGGAMSFSFWSLLIKDGKILTSDGSFDWKKHSLIGNDKDNNLFLIVTDTNYGYGNLMQTISKFNLQNLEMLDGGGSSQLSLKGETLFPSEDNRPVPDFIVVK
ncbi:MAG: phosphodiester glycosidase family protein [Streptococcaceae bacterium]|jgi:exopolysaccharide biosynthesis protein|nr:phosphodiester glycosidase family protein [Streptococcaceae bacterium]